MKTKPQIRHFILFLAALAGAVWFFIGYPVQDTRSAIQTNLSQKEVKKIAAHQLHHFGYSARNFEVKEVIFGQNQSLLDSLQASLGRNRLISLLKSDTLKNIKPFYREITFVKQSGDQQQILQNEKKKLTIWFDSNGHFIALKNPSDFIPHTKAHNNEEIDAIKAANHYLKKSGWNFTSFSVDTVTSHTINSIEAAKVSYKLMNPELGQDLNLNITVSPTGQLISFKSDYNQIERQRTDPEVIWAFVLTILISIFGLVLLIIFYMRMRSRVIDTQPAVVAAVIVGFVVAVYIALQVVGPAGLLAASYQTSEKIFFLIFLSFTVAGACLLAFILFAVGDSMTRQYWPKKLHHSDYLWQGMIFNKPIGSTLLKSIALSFVLVGLWTLLLSLFPKLYFSAEHIFISQSASWAILRLLSHSIWSSFFTLVSIFMVIAIGIYGKQKRKWLAGIAAVIASGIIMPQFQYGPPWTIFLASAIFGLFLYFIFTQWNFLTLLLSYILFLTLLGSTSGWIISNSPDFVMFTGAVFIFAALAATGIAAVFWGRDEQQLADYEPEYVKLHADEERIKQELQIARDVQQSFLPKKTPAHPNLDIAAICIPAYETGGDYYDFIELGENRIGVAIGDVSGKGIQAAFYMTFVKGLLHSLSREALSPAEILKKANYFFFDNAGKSTFISLIYGVIDLEEKTFTFARAGHNPVLHFNAATNKVDELRPNGLGLGLTKDKIFDNKINEIKLSLTDDELLLLYTDGITEALNETHQFFGTDRLIDVIKKIKEESASTIISAISEEIKRFTGIAKQHDDMTVMAIRLTGGNENNEK